MKKTNADIYIHKCGSPGIVTFFSKINKCKLIKILASDAEITGEKIFENNHLIYTFLKFLQWFDLKFSDVVISQNNFQKKILKNKYGICSKLIRNSIKIVNNRNENGEYILWVGTIRKIKQPEIFLKLAKKLPNYKFIMIGGVGENQDLYDYIKEEAKSISNLEFKGFVPHDKIYRYYNKSKMLVSTSKMEGFPNIFLEAWMHSIPVVSLNVDPDGIISKYKLGYHSKTFEQVIYDIRILLKNKKLRQKMGENGRKYVEKEHSIGNIIGEYEKIFSEFKMIKNINSVR